MPLKLKLKLKRPTPTPEPQPDRPPDRQADLLAPPPADAEVEGRRMGWGVVGARTLRWRVITRLTTPPCSQARTRLAGALLAHLTADPAAAATSIAAAFAPAPDGATAPPRRVLDDVLAAALVAGGNASALLTPILNAVAAGTLRYGGRLAPFYAFPGAAAGAGSAEGVSAFVRRCAGTSPASPALGDLLADVLAAAPAHHVRDALVACLVGSNTAAAVVALLTPTLPSRRRLAQALAAAALTVTPPSLPAATAAAAAGADMHAASRGDADALAAVAAVAQGVAVAGLIAPLARSGVAAALRDALDRSAAALTGSDAEAVGASLTDLPPDAATTLTAAWTAALDTGTPLRDGGVDYAVWLARVAHAAGSSLTPVSQHALTRAAASVSPASFAASTLPLLELGPAVGTILGAALDRAPRATAAAVVAAALRTAAASALTNAALGVPSPPPPAIGALTALLGASPGAVAAAGGDASVARALTALGAASPAVAAEAACVGRVLEGV